MSDKSEFSGFPKEGLEFLKDLASNNNREWFHAYKTDYRTFLQEPAQEFVVELGTRLSGLFPGIVADTRTNGSGSIMRIHRDIRFSKDKTPYNTKMRFFFWEGKGKKMDNPGFYFCFDDKSGNIFAGQYLFPKVKLELFRDAVLDDHLGPELESILESVKGAGDYSINGEQYKKVPREFDPMHDRAYLLKYKGLYIEASHIERSVLTSQDLVNVCFNHCKNMAPLHHWLVKVNTLL